MLITINLPDNTAAIKYAVADENGYILEDRPVTVGMIQNVSSSSDLFTRLPAMCRTNAESTNILNSCPSRHRAEPCDISE